MDQTDNTRSEKVVKHGLFRSYLRRTGKESDDKCLYCREEDTAEGTVFFCNHWRPVRDKTKAALRMESDITSESLIDGICKSVKK